MALSTLFSLPWGRALAVITALSCAWSSSVSAAEAAPAACPPLLQKSFKRLQDDAPQNLCQYAGKVLLVVNTASYCGFTPQYEGLEKLYAQDGNLARTYKATTEGRSEMKRSMANGAMDAGADKGAASASKSSNAAAAASDSAV